MGTAACRNRSVSDATSALDGGRAAGTPATGDGPPRAAGPPHWTALLGSSGRWPVGPVPQSGSCQVQGDLPTPPDSASPCCRGACLHHCPPPLSLKRGHTAMSLDRGWEGSPSSREDPSPRRWAATAAPHPVLARASLCVCGGVLSSLLWGHRRDLAGSGDFLCPHLLVRRWESLHPAEPGGSRRRRGRRPRAQLPPCETRSRGGRGGGPASAGGCPARRERVVHQNSEQRPKRVCPPSGLHVRRACPHGAACLPGTDAESGLKPGDEAGPSRTRVLKSARGF